jgi:hypothetical protein
MAVLKSFCCIFGAGDFVNGGVIVRRLSRWLLC